MNVVILRYLICAFAITAFISAPLCAATPGAPDSSFGQSGSIVFLMQSPQTVKASVEQPDGRLLFAGQHGTDVLVTRATTDGAPDSGFGNFGGGGRTLIDLGGTEIANDIELQSDGKIVVLVSSSTAAASVILIRLNPDGTTDSTFGTNGVATIPGALDFAPTGIKILTDGRILVLFSSASRITLMRVNFNGTLDTTFGTAGIASFAGLTTSIGNDLVIRTDGRILVCGSADLAVGLIVRFTATGALDTTFATNGFVTFDLTPGGSDSAARIALDTSGRIFFAGAYGTSPLQPFVARFNGNGTPDTTFSGDGFAQFSGLTTGHFVSGLSVRDNGSVVFGGDTSNGLAYFSSVDAAGTPSTAFGLNGFIRSKRPNGGSEVAFAFSPSHLTMVFTIDQNSTRNSVQERYLLERSDSQQSDFDGDGFGDVAVYRPSVGTWFVLKSSDNTVIFKQFGLNGDIPLDGDFDGDARTDFGIFRPSSGIWFVEYSSDGTNFARTFGVSTDQPATNDFDRDGRADVAVFRPSSGTWFILRSSSNFTSFFSTPFGQNGDIPIGRSFF